MSSRVRTRAPAASGFTLLEIMIVLAIVALMSVASVRGFRSITRADLRSSTAKVSGAIKLLFDRASTTGKHHRLVIDLDQGRLWAEVSDDRFFIPRDAETDQERRAREGKEAEEDEEAQRKREEAAERAGRDTGGSLPMGSSFDMSKLDVGEFRPKRARFAAFKEVAIKPMTLKNAKFHSVYTPRVTDPITSGRAYIYFFPLGQTEPAIVTLSDESGDTIYSLVVHPITGRVRVYNEEIKPPGGAQTDDEGNRVVP